MKYLSLEQTHQAIEKAAEQSSRNYILVLTLLKSGIRVTELIDLTPQNINFQAKYLHIKGKGGKIRNVDVPSDLLQQLKLFIKNKKVKNRQRIFKVTRQRVFQITRTIADMNPHAFRHTYAINLLRKTGNIRYVQKQLGHSSISSTQIYLQFIEYEQEKKKLGTLFQ